MSFDRRHSTTPRLSASNQRRNSLGSAIAEHAPCLMIRNEAEEEGGGRNAPIASAATANHHPLGNVRLSTAITSNGGVDASSFLSSSLGQVGGDQTCSSPPFTLPFEVYVKMSQFVTPDLGQLARLVAVLPPAIREYFLQCYLKDNWPFLVHALSDYREGTFRRRFQLWFSRNPDYLETLETDIEVPSLVRRVLTDPVEAIAHGSVDLLRHILDNTDADVNGTYEYHDGIPQSLLEIAIVREECACVDYIFSRNDLDVYTVISDPGRDRMCPVIFEVFSFMTEPTSNPNIANYLPRLLRHPSCDINRSHVIGTRRGAYRRSLLDGAINQALLENDPNNFPLHLNIILLILRQGGIPFLSSDADIASPLETARWTARNGTAQEATIGQMVLELFCDYQAEIVRMS